jgi:hypothetical protein
MNEQPFEKPPKSWEPKLTPWFVHATSPFRRRTLRKSQRFVRVDFDGLENVRKVIDAGHGILITPNHSFHYDSYFMIEAGVRVKRPFHFMAAWQVFAMSRFWEVFYLQRHGCFSVDREGTDLKAFRQALSILQESPHPLVVFPEGDIYHTNDHVTPFRDGAGAMVVSAARKGPRPISVVPCAIKAIYVEDPTPKLEAMMTRLEERLLLRPHRSQKLTERLYRFGDAILSLRELEYAGEARSGPIPARVKRLISEMLDRQEQQFGAKTKTDFTPERVKELRRRHIERMTAETPPTNEELEVIKRAMEELFTIMQIFSYPGDYVAKHPSVERIAETLDKFEEDVFKMPYPTNRGARRAIIRFGEPISVPTGKSQQPSAIELTKRMESSVQALLDQINQENPTKLLH